MIDFIIGNVEHTEEGHLVLSANDIGYSLQVSLIAIQKFSLVKDKIKVYTYLHVTENGISLFGFYDRFEREVFIKLTSVSKVGPKVALSILSLYPPQKLISLIISQDSKAISQAGGVGKKLAENIIINLKDKFDHIVLNEENEHFILDSIDDRPKQEAVEALVALGFEYQYCTKIVQTIFSEELNSTELIARSLQMIGNKGE